MKRRLSLRQKRIIKNQDKSLSDLSPPEQGLLIAHHGASVTVESQHGEEIHCQLRQNLGSLVCGDMILFQRDPAQSGIVIKRLSRRNMLGRPDSQNTLKPIAANIDQMIIVIAPVPEINYVLLDSYLVLAETLGIDAIILLNKVDLMDTTALAHCQQILTVYQALNYPVLKISIKQQEGLSALKQHIRDKVQVVVGQSGVGKSSLIDYLIPNRFIRIGDVSQQNKKGRHTTTTATLYHGEDCDLIDSPGIREIGLWQMDLTQIAQGFREFKPYLGLCKFRDCRHLDDPHCAIVAAKKTGAIRQERYQNFQKMCEKL